LNNEQIDELRDWIISLRDRYCPPSSYDRNTRSSKIVIDAFSSFGSYAISFARCNYFENVVAIESNDERFQCLNSNVNLFQLAGCIQCVKSEFITWYKSNYSTEKYANSLIFMNIDAATILLNDEDGKYYLCEPNVDKYLLSKQCEQMLNGQSLTPIEKTLAICPMIILQIPIYEGKEHYNNLINSLKQIPSRMTEVNESISEQYKFVALIGHENLTNNVALVRKKQRRNLSIPVVQDLSEFRYIWASKSDLKQRVKQFLGGKLFWIIKDHSSRNFIMNELDRMASSTQYNDKVIYQRLADLIGQYRDNKQPIGQQFISNSRSDSRVNDILEILPPEFKPDNILDIGCAEGSITALLGKALNLEASNIHGCDVRNLDTFEGFCFKRILDDNTLPYDANSQSLIVCLMVLHHIPDLSTTISEIYRILKPGGYFVIREHDCNPEELATVLDIIHGLYALCLVNEDPNFCETYFARYYRKDECRQMICNIAPFEYVDSTQVKILNDKLNRVQEKKGRYNAPRRKIQQTNIPNPQGFYYALFRKPDNTVPSNFSVVDSQQLVDTKEEQPRKKLRNK
jgi:SAM-dependent methyltransferase